MKTDRKFQLLVILLVLVAIAVGQTVINTTGVNISPVSPLTAGGPGTFSTLALSKTITPAGTTGNQTINAASGSVNFAASGTIIVVTNSLVTVNSIIQGTVGTNDTACKAVQCVAANGSFSIYPNSAPSAETRVNFLVTN